MGTVISIIVLCAVLFFAIRYIVKAKRRGVKCIGCPNGGENCHCGCNKE